MRNAVSPLAVDVPIAVPVTWAIALATPETVATPAAVPVAATIDEDLITPPIGVPMNLPII